MGKKVSYEDMIEELESIVNTMSNEQLTLEEAIKNYEKGMKLHSKIYNLLEQAEGKIKIIKENEEKDFLDSRD